MIDQIMLLYMSGQSDTLVFPKVQKNFLQEERVNSERAQINISDIGKYWDLQVNFSHDL